MLNDKKFYISMKKFFDAGLIKEIYVSKDLSICNISNCCYAIFDYDMCSETKVPFGIATEPKYLESIIEDNDRFYNWLNSMSKDDQKKLMIHCDERIFNIMLQEKQKTDRDGPIVSLEYEQELIEKYQNNKVDKKREISKL